MLVDVVVRDSVLFFQIDSQCGSWCKTRQGLWVRFSEIGPYHENYTVYDRIYNKDGTGCAEPGEIDEFFGDSFLTIDGTARIFPDSTLTGQPRSIHTGKVAIIRRRKEGIIGDQFTIEVFNIKASDDITNDTVLGWAAANTLLAIGAQPNDRALCKGIVGFQYIEYSGAYYPLEYLWLRTVRGPVCLKNCTKVFRSPDKSMYLAYTQERGSVLLDTLGNQIITTDIQLCSPLWSGNYIFTRSYCTDDNVYLVNIADRTVRSLIQCPTKYSGEIPNDGYYEWPAVEINSRDSTITTYFYRNVDDRCNEIKVVTTLAGRILTTSIIKDIVQPQFSGEYSIYTGTILWD